MNILTRIIGLAPSELDDLSLMDRLKRERLRVQASLAKFKVIPQAKMKVAKQTKSKTPTAVISAKVLEACKQLNITVEEFIEMHKKLKENQ